LIKKQVTKNKCSTWNIGNERKLFMNVPCGTLSKETIICSFDKSGNKKINQ
jgi:hypothetical protein